MGLLEGVTLWDVGVERQIEISGPDAFTFADMMTPRDRANCAVRASSCGVIPRGRGVDEAVQHPETAPTRQGQHL